MSEESAILAQFSDWRTVKGRKVLQLIFEVPLEEQAKVLTHLGAPMPLADLWCGIARVAPGRGKAAGGKTAPGPDQPGVASPLEATPAVGNSKPKRRWQDMPPSQRAALRIKEREFWDYIGEAHGVVCQDEHMADAWLKDRLDISSKSDIAAFPQKAHHFDLLDGKYQAWRQARGHGVI